MASGNWMKSLCAALLAGLAGGGCTPAPDLAAPAATCVVGEAEFDGWKAAGAAPGFTPPDSAGFVEAGHCSFYKWSSRMFLWLTSVDPAGNLNLFSPIFYNAVESPATGGFQLIPNAHARGAGPVKIVFRVRANKPRLLRLRTGRERDEASPGQAGGGVLVVNGQPVAVPGKTGYATYPLAYYTIQVNDVYAGLHQHQSSVPYYTSGPSRGDLPTSRAQAQQIQAAAGASYADLDQLAIEVKTAWVDTAYLTREQADGLVTIVADVPAFTRTTDAASNLVLGWDGRTTATRALALTGIHIVGTVAGHPEMIWATFESVFNSPNATYAYLNRNYDLGTRLCRAGTSCITTVPFSASSRLPSLFYNGRKGAPAPSLPIVQTAASTDNNQTITSTAPTLIPTSVSRLNPWGNQQPATPSVRNPVVVNNTMLVSLKASLRARLGGSGGRGGTLANYFLVGGLWSNGIIPPAPGSREIGSLFLANTTMETFQQVTPGNPDPNDTAANCFSCHGDTVDTATGKRRPGTSVSHVFPNITN